MSSEDELEWEDNPSNLPFHYHMLAGSTAGLAEHISIFPIDTLKTHLQCERCGAISPWQTWDCATKIVKREGIFRLWRGVSAMFAGCVPAHAAYFSVFEQLKYTLELDQQGHHPIRAAIAGASAAVSHDLCMTPFDVVKQRMQLGYYKNVMHCVTTIAKTEGIRSFYVSLPTTLIMNIPFGCIMVAVNESAKKYLNPNPTQFNLTSSMISGSIAGAIAAALTTPLDVIKTRLQTQNLEPCPKTESMRVNTNNVNNVNNMVISVTNKASSIEMGPIEITKSILKADGIRGMFRGMVPRMLVHAPSIAISWTVYEAVKKVFCDNL